MGGPAGRLLSGRAGGWAGGWASGWVGRCMPWRQGGGYGCWAWLLHMPRERSMRHRLCEDVDLRHAQAEAGKSGWPADALPSFLLPSLASAVEPVGTVVFFPGCHRFATYFFPASTTNCPECVGMPEHLSHTKQARARGGAARARVVVGTPPEGQAAQRLAWRCRGAPACLVAAPSPAPTPCNACPCTRRLSWGCNCCQRVKEQWRISARHSWRRPPAPARSPPLVPGARLQPAGNEQPRRRGWLLVFHRQCALRQRPANGGPCRRHCCSWSPCSRRRRRRPAAAAAAACCCRRCCRRPCCHCWPFCCSCSCSGSRRPRPALPTTRRPPRCHQAMASLRTFLTNTGQLGRPVYLWGFSSGGVC